MLSPRWRKVLRDLWGNKTRTLLVVFSIAVGVFAIGTVMHSYLIVARELAQVYPTAKLPSFTIYCEGFDEELIRTIRRMPGVRDADGRAALTMRLKTGPQEWKSLYLMALPDYDDIHVNKVWPQRAFLPDPSIGAERGAWPPPERGVVIERASFLMPGLMPRGAKVGDNLVLESLDGKRRDLQFAGLAHEPGRVPATFVGMAYGYINRDTLEWLTGWRGMNELAVIVEGNTLDRAHIARIAQEVEDKVEKSGRRVYAKEIPEPGKRPYVDDIFQGMLLILGALGLGSLFLSGFLVINTISAILAQHVRQIGMMKAIGARGSQVVGLYLILVLAFGLLALVVAIPLGALVARETSQLLAGFINVNFPAFSIPLEVLILDVVVGLIAPLAAAFLPIVRGTRLTVREALTDYGLGRGPARPSRLRRLFGCLARPFQGLAHLPAAIGVALARLLPRPLLLSLRNTVRHRLRLLLTMGTLVLGGMIFIAVFTVRASMLHTLDDLFAMWRFDAQIEFNAAYRMDLLYQEALRVPGVVKAEAFGIRLLRRLRPNDTESNNLVVFAPYAGTEMIRPRITEGRWLLPEDENALVVSVEVQKLEPDIKVGDEITLKINNRKTTWRVVGVVQAVGSGAVMYANYPYYARVTGEMGRSGIMWITMEQHTPAYQAQVKRALEDSFKRAGLRLNNTITTSEIRERNEFYFNIIVVLLAVMAVLMAVVGGLGLMGTMSINVIERTREIGVMRAIGATDRAVRGIVVTEGLLIGVLSWLFGTFLAFLVGRSLSNMVGMVFFRVPLSYTFSVGGVVIWLVLVIVLASLASVLPARRATRLSVREVLAYE